MIVLTLSASKLSLKTSKKTTSNPKDPETDKVFALHELIATTEQTEILRQKYLAGNFGYGHAKTELLNLILTRFKTERELFTYFMNNLPELEEKLQEGAAKTRTIALQTLSRVRKSVGV